MTDAPSFLAPRPPDGTKLEMDFLDSTFFKTPGQRLPTPAEVRALSTDLYTSPQPKPITFRNPDIFVKFGRYVTVAEAQCLWMLQRVFQGTVPVPEPFGWRVDDEGFVIHPFTHQNLPDYTSTTGSPPSLPQSRLPASLEYKDPCRDLLPDDGAVTFSHADLHRGNIMISSSAPFRVLAVVDWGQAAWYPDYWEYCKALYTCWYEDEWRRDWVNRFLSPRLLEPQVFSEYTMAIGAVWIGLILERGGGGGALPG
ncbi:hypothetical protein P170DRAFT_486173 [Aspergillus steynii IBT 23096]|uniref:Aminoglycoside phosphotransferase domain-containing protein n=1 Tax=Aspergillus steynii IBT 23096 TaxID=1392250 RepID=A0A2I2FRS0_9EURO|nr:uncharacterized protein P170DRAFT_486173 [Aspergillus steynii IBT 23096]PLB43311.1 hypothetical protein P170DRAFT_486173 [Aspergillus steynii IBT 23096]